MATPARAAESSATKLRQMTSMERLVTEFLAQSEYEGPTAEVAIDWSRLAYQIRIPKEHVEALWDHLGKEGQGRLWAVAIQHRVETTLALPGIQKGTRDRVVNKAIERLEQMLDSGLIRDVGELLAISRVLGPQIPSGNQPPSQGPSLTFNIGAPNMKMQDGQTLPGGDEVIMLNLTPRAAAGLQKTKEKAENTERIIDGEMLDVKSLREMIHPGQE
jgi:hypothetical protein